MEKILTIKKGIIMTKLYKIQTGEQWTNIELRVNPQENMEITEILSVVTIQSSLPMSFWESISITLINALCFDNTLSNYGETVSKVVPIESNAI